MKRCISVLAVFAALAVACDMAPQGNNNPNNPNTPMTPDNRPTLNPGETLTPPDLPATGSSTQAATNGILCVTIDDCLFEANGIYAPYVIDCRTYCVFRTCSSGAQCGAQNPICDFGITPPYCMRDPNTTTNPPPLPADAGPRYCSSDSQCNAAVDEICLFKSAGCGVATLTGVCTRVLSSESCEGEGTGYYCGCDGFSYRALNACVTVQYSRTGLCQTPPQDGGTSVQPDAGAAMDAGTADGGTVLQDAGVVDAGADGGVNPCALFQCTANASCVVSQGVASCQCNSGYTLSGTNCVLADAGIADGGAPDGGLVSQDAGVPDGGVADAGVVDGGVRYANLAAPITPSGYRMTIRKVFNLNVVSSSDPRFWKSWPFSYPNGPSQAYTEYGRTQTIITADRYMVLDTPIFTGWNGNMRAVHVLNGEEYPLVEGADGGVVTAAQVPGLEAIIAYEPGQASVDLKTKTIVCRFNGSTWEPKAKFTIPTAKTATTAGGFDYNLPECPRQP